MGCKRTLKALYGQPPRGRGLRFRSRTRCPIRLALRLIAAARQSQIPLQNPAGSVHEIDAIADPGSARRFAARAAWDLWSSSPDCPRSEDAEPTQTANSENSKANRIETMKGPAESGQICSVGRRKIAKKIAKNKRCYANTLR